MFLEIKDLNKYYGEKSARVQVLNNINLSLKKGKICVVLGQSGSGKSTLLNIIGCLEDADEGKVVLDGIDLINMNAKEKSLLRREKMGFIFQFYNLVPNLNVAENIKVCESLAKKPIDREELLQTLGLEEHKFKFPNQLSGGQQQRCAIARALVKNPELLLCDEPTGALDYKSSKDVLELLENINSKYNTSIIIVTHNEAIAEMADIVIRVKDGTIVEQLENTSKKSVKEIQW
ncbi:MAG: ABC transporter ATP-binding protein [Lachnospiraceae bacterium]|jgi:putative ABC transport system ATP-binding protein|nr:ABC transporter ATP-binding protein [Lachnospiraceae bacterium]